MPSVVATAWNVAISEAESVASKSVQERFNFFDQLFGGTESAAKKKSKEPVDLKEKENVDENVGENEEIISITKKIECSVSPDGAENLPPPKLRKEVNMSKPVKNAANEALPKVTQNKTEVSPKTTSNPVKLMPKLKPESSKKEKPRSQSCTPENSKKFKLSLEAKLNKNDQTESTTVPKFLESEISNLPESKASDNSKKLELSDTEVLQKPKLLRPKTPKVDEHSKKLKTARPAKVETALKTKALKADESEIDAKPEFPWQTIEAQKSLLEGTSECSDSDSQSKSSASTVSGTVEVHNVSGSS